MKRGKGTFTSSSVKSNIKNIININLAEKLAKTVKKKKKTKSVKRVRSRREGRELEQPQDTVDLKPKPMMPRGSALTSGSAIRLNMPNQTFGAIPPPLQPSTYAIPDKRVLGTWQPSSFAPRGEPQEQAIKILAEAIKKVQPSGPNARITSSINPYDPNSIPIVADINAINADDSVEKKRRDKEQELQLKFMEEKDRAKEASLLERGIQAEREFIRRQAEQEAKQALSPLSVSEEQAGAIVEAGERQPELFKGQDKEILFSKKFYEYLYDNSIYPSNIVRVKADVKDADKNIWNQWLRDNEPQLWTYIISILTEAGKPKNFTTAIENSIDSFLRKKSSQPSSSNISSSSSFGGIPKPVIESQQQPVFGKDIQPIIAQRDIESIQPTIAIAQRDMESVRSRIRSRSKPRDVEVEVPSAPIINPQLRISDIPPPLPQQKMSSKTKQKYIEDIKELKDLIIEQRPDLDLKTVSFENPVIQQMIRAQLEISDDKYERDKEYIKQLFLS